MRTFTPTALKQFDGKNGAPAYIAYQGVVYDVSNSYFWRGGRHWVRHSAGSDLTAELAQAPHSAAMLKRVPEVGVMVHPDAASQDGP